MSVWDHRFTKNTEMFTKGLETKTETFCLMLSVFSTPVFPDAHAAVRLLESMHSDLIVLLLRLDSNRTTLLFHYLYWSRKGLDYNVAMYTQRTWCFQY